MAEKHSSHIGASAAVFMLGLAALPGAAQAGFLDQLFGGVAQQAPQVAPAPDYHYDTPSYLSDVPVRHHAKRKVVYDKPKLQRPTDLMHDITLRNGDAVMTKGGLQVYTGEDGEPHHSKGDFVALDEVSGMSKQEQKTLVTVDATRNDPFRNPLNPDTIASGRSAAVASPIVAGHPIIDAAGKTVRYVGP